MESEYKVKPDAISEFIGNWAFLSNFAPCPIKVPGGKIYATAEHLYQASKASCEGDHEVIRKAPTPGAAKKRGKAIQIRPKWNAIKVGLMKSIVKMKFDQNEEAKKRLLATGDRQLVEGNWWGDTFWGTVFVGNRWYGRNTLGEILMALRNEYRGVTPKGPEEPEPKRNLLI